MVAAALHSTGPLCGGLACTSLSAACSRSSSGLILALPSAVSNLPSRFKGSSPLPSSASPALHSSFLPSYTKDNSHSNFGSFLSAGKSALSTNDRSERSVPFSKGRAMASMLIEPAVIVGYGRVGQALEKMGGGNDVVVKRGEKVPDGTKGPILVCTRNDALDEVIANTPEDRREGKGKGILLFGQGANMRTFFWKVHFHLSLGQRGLHLLWAIQCAGRTVSLHAEVSEKYDLTRVALLGKVCGLCAEQYLLFVDALRT
jgi:hypothetical protein